MSIFFDFINQMNRELTRSEQGYQDIFDNIDAAVWTFDKETSFITVSAGFEKMLGFSREELFRNPSIWEETIYEEDLEMVSLHMSKLYSGLPSTLEHRIRFRTGEIRWVQSAGTSVYHKENHAVRINGVLLDITEKKAAQEELEKNRHLFQRILNTVDVAIWSYSEVSQRIEYVSEALEKITGYPLNKIMTRENWKDIIHHDDIFIFEQLSVKVRQGISDASEYRIIHANGEVRWVQNRIIPTMDDSGNMTRLDGVVIDITSRKMMEEALHRNEQRYKSLFEYNSDVICELDLNGNTLAFNQVAGKSLFGNKISSWVDILGSVSSQRAAVYFEMAKQGQAQNYEMVSCHQNGKKVHWDIKNVPIYVNHDVVGIFVIGRDITQKKETEKALTESEAQYKFIAENMTDMVRIIDVNGMCIYASPSHKKLIGYSPEQYMEEQIFLRMVHPDDLEAVGLLFNEMVESKQPKNAQFRVTRADGEHIYLEEYGTPVVDHNGKVENIVIVSRDITQKKLTEKALAESESQFRLITGNMTDLLGLLDIKGTFWYASPSYQKVLGFDHEWMVGTSLFDRIHPDDLAKAQNQFLEMLLTKTTKPVRCRFIHSEGRTVEVDCLGTPVLSQDGEVESIIVVSRDITDKVQMEKELTESEERYRTLIEHSPQPMASHCDGKFVYINPAGIELIGAKDANEIIGKSVFSIIYPDYMKMARKRAQSLTKNKYLESLEYKMIRLDGQMIEVELIGIYDDATQTTLTVFSDITERKKMERALQESEERYRRLVELSPVAISVYKDGQFVYVNPAGIKVAGASRPEDIVGTNPLDWVHPDDKEFARKRMENTFLHWYSSPAEHRVIRLDGEIIDVMVTAIYDPKSLSAQLVYEDITARKQAEQLIRQSEDRYIRLQNSLDEFSLGLFGVMKVSEMERRLVKEVQVVLNSAHVSLIEVDRNNQVNMKSGNHDIPDTFLKEILNSDQRPYPVCEIIEASEGYFLKIGEIRGKSYILCVDEKAPALKIKPKRVWLKTITRYVNVLYDSFRLIEDLTKELEQRVAQHVAPSWLLRLVFNLSENERKRLSQDLHDAALQEQIIWYRKLDQLSTDRSVPQEIREQLEQMAQGLLDVIYQIRITCNELRPPLLKEEGLVSSLEALFEFTQLRTNYCIQFDAAAFHHTLTDHLLIGIYRIVQELMANATKHSNASSVRVTLSSFPDRVELNYEDDGIGMDLTGMEDSFNSMGVYGMKERVRSMEGEIVFHSSPNEGLAIFISIPAL